MSKMNCLRNKRFSDVLMRRGATFQALASCATLALCNSAVPRPISSAIAPLESYDLSLVFQAIER